MSRPRVLLLTRPGCGLCEELREALEREFPGRFQLEDASVDSRAEWRARFGRSIPVLLGADGAVLLETRFDPVPLRRYLGGA